MQMAMASRANLPVRELSIKEASARLNDPDFQRAWDTLYRSCPWATVFQSPTFVRIWYEVYAPVYEPLLLCSEHDGCLDGLLAVAVERKSGRLRTCGFPQAEYPVWIAAAGLDEAFLGAALRALWQRFPQGSLSFTFLPPGAPVGYFGSAAGVPELRNAVLVEQPRPVHILSQESARESLKKKSNKSRLNRLARTGPVHYVNLTSRADYEKHLSNIAAYCDLRQGAVNGDCPFHDDPLKASFFARLFEHPELVHGAALMAGDILAAYHIGLRNRDELCLGLISHSPFLAEHSPGKLLLLHLTADLADRGFARFDLTPGGDYKERFQNSHDTAYTLTVFATRRDALVARGRLSARQKIKTVLARAGVSPQRLEKQAGGVLRHLSHPGTLPRKVVRLIRKRIASTEEMRFYALDPSRDTVLARGPNIEFAVNRIQDLVLYEQGGPGEPSRQRFLSDCLSRLASGEQVFTFVEQGRLLHSAWLAPRYGPVASGVGNSVNMPANSYTLWDDYTPPAARGRGLHKASIRARMDHGVRLGASLLLINVYADNIPSRKNIEDSGFRYFGSMIRRWKLGKYQVEWTSGPDHPAFPSLAGFALLPTGVSDSSNCEKSSG
jgi:CelD/BcsL family acetyltransferase involved in cellulose biosynthesis/GNAT superfamily N-acetyltransferase